MYFDVDDSFYHGDLQPVEVEVEVLANSREVPFLEYDSTDPRALYQGAFKRATGNPNQEPGALLKVTFRLQDAAFTGRSNGHDFRLVPPGPEELSIHQVVVRKLK